MSDNPSLLGTVINMRYYFQLADLDGNGKIDRAGLRGLIQSVVADAGRPPLSDERLNGLLKSAALRTGVVSALPRTQNRSVTPPVAWPT